MSCVVLYMYMYIHMYLYVLHAIWIMVTHYFDCTGTELFYYYTCSLYSMHVHVA